MSRLEEDDDFDFMAIPEELPVPAASPSSKLPPPAPTGLGDSPPPAPTPSKVPDRDDRDKSLCLACPQKKHASIWCKDHEKVYNNLYSQAHSEQGLEDGQDVAFRKIFGERGKDMNQIAAGATILGYVDKFGLESKRGRNGRGSLDLQQFINEEGRRNAVEDEDDGKVKTDQESFVVSMKNCRGWDQKKAWQNGLRCTTALILSTRRTTRATRTQRGCMSPAACIVGSDSTRR